MKGKDNLNIFLFHVALNSLVSNQKINEALLFFHNLGAYLIWKKYFFIAILIKIYLFLLASVYDCCWELEPCHARDVCVTMNMRELYVLLVWSYYHYQGSTVADGSNVFKWIQYILSFNPFGRLSKQWRKQKSTIIECNYVLLKKINFMILWA